MAFQLSGETTYGILGTQNVQIMHFRQEERPKLAFQVQSARKRCRFTSKIGLNILNLYKGSFIQEKVDTLGSSLLPISMHACGPICRLGTLRKVEHGKSILAKGPILLPSYITENLNQIDTYLYKSILQDRQIWQLILFCWHCNTTSPSISPHPMNRARRWYTVVTLLYDLCQFLIKMGWVRTDHLLFSQTPDQCDQIGRFFVLWATV